MKKILLSLFAFIAMVGMVNAQRAWAYDLGLNFASDTYTFSFKATTNANATLIFTDAEGTELATYDAGAVVAGANTVSLTKAQLPEGTEIHWAVKLTGDAIGVNAKGFTLEVTDASRGIYNFYLPQGVAVDNNPESETFGNIFVAQPTHGATDGSSVRADNQKRGIFVYNQALDELNPTSNVGIIPSNVTLSDVSRQAMHRIAVNPVDNNVAFAYNVSGSTAVWSVPANNLGGEATNLIAGTAIKMANSICFDEKGVLYVMDNANTSNGGTLYKVVDGVATKIVQSGIWGVADNAIASDGRGGIWVAQNRYALDAYAVLSHVNANGEIDFKVTNSSNAELQGLFPNANGNVSYRGQCAYYVKDDLLAFGGNYRSSIYKITYDAETGVPSIALSYRTPYLSQNIDGLAFDFAGDLYLMSATAERFYKFASPTKNNTCTTPAPKNQVIINSSSVVTYTIKATANDDKMGTVTGGGVYLKDDIVTLNATPSFGHKFVKWSNESTDNPFVFNATEDLEISAIFEVLSHTVTLGINDANKGSVEGAGTYSFGTEITITATPAEGYEFAGWSNGSKENPLTITITEDVELTAKFRAVLATSIALNTLPVQDYSANIIGTMKRAVQNGENTIVLTHEADGTPHIYNIAHITKTVAELSQEDIVARDPENAGDYLSISDIALTEDGKLIASNYMRCEQGTTPATGYKVGEIRYYIWNDITKAPTRWFTTNRTANSTYADVSYTFAIKGTSTNAQLMSTAVHNTNRAARINLHTVVNGVETAYHRFGLHTTASEYTEAKQGLNFQLTATPLDNIWTLEGELTDPTSFVVPVTAGNEYNGTALTGVTLGKKYNGASYLANYYEHHLMIAPYADGEGKLAGVKVIDIVDGFASAKVLTTNTDLATAIDATTAAATATIDTNGDLTIYLWADAKVYTFSEKEQTDGPATAIDNTVIAPQVQKIIRDGQVLIIRDGKTYNMMGQEVK